MVRKRKLKKRIKKLKHKLKKHRRWTKTEIEQMRQLLSEQSISYSQAMKNMQQQNITVFRSLQEHLQVKKLDKTALAGILTDLAAKISRDSEQQNGDQGKPNDS